MTFERALWHLGGGLFAFLTLKIANNSLTVTRGLLKVWLTLGWLVEGPSGAVPVLSDWVQKTVWIKLR